MLGPLPLSWTAGRSMSRESFGLAESSHINEHCKREVVDLIAVACAVPRSFAALPVRPMHVYTSGTSASRQRRCLQGTLKLSKGPHGSETP